MHTIRRPHVLSVLGVLGALAILWWLTVWMHTKQVRIACASTLEGLYGLSYESSFCRSNKTPGTFDWWETWWLSLLHASGVWFVSILVILSLFYGLMGRKFQIRGKRISAANEDSFHALLKWVCIGAVGAFALLGVSAVAEFLMS